MFTGLIQSLGTIQFQSGDRISITCAEHTAHTILKDLEIGDSVAVDGICLTVEEILTQGFLATASPETLSRTRLGKGKLEYNNVNLETSLRVGSKLGGHFVTGHIDGVGHFQTAEQTANSWEISFIAPETVARYIVPKGSITVNGVSLTVAESNSDGTWFKVAVIPHTYAHTNLYLLKNGSQVNLEADILGKYVEKLVNFGKVPQTITPEFLIENGYV
ncbi:riboflavin synthase subunit alpha [[Phormidium ambiguum] IAM M-71]|uniref:Riboflavin synthase n=1 Tax=[Phormidium ambiguum] IAM M-71 TaxID=454136 RepID=A0A1U7IRC7_9CYAN|nr:riboflavin synthase [Phormidium ambiguum]OKH39956.1 riboflavin synthase subunit alpha [Phormidium ambiguum IAM M-71]